MALVTASEIQAAVPGLQPWQVAQLPEVAEDASAEVEDWCRRTFALATLTKPIAPYGCTLLVLRAPIISIASIVDEDGADLTWSIRDEDAGLVDLDGPAEGRVTVTWTSGFDPIPRPVRRAVIETAAAMLARSQVGAMSSDIKSRQLSERKIEFFTAAEGDSSIPTKARERLAPYRWLLME